MSTDAPSHLLGPVRSALARRPASTAADGYTTVDLGVPDLALLNAQYDAYLDAVRGRGVDVHVVEPAEAFPDGHFVEDPFIVWRGVAFACVPGAEGRRDEGASLRPHLASHQIIEADDPAARIDGGDVLFCADRVLIGLSARTNAAGADALTAALRTVDPDVRVDHVPFTGPLHLKSGLTELAPNVLVRDPAWQTSYDLSWAEVITLPAAEGHAADVLPLNGAVLIVDGAPALAEAAAAHVEEVIVLDMSEFTKMDGGLTCLTLRW